MVRYAQDGRHSLISYERGPFICLLHGAQHFAPLGYTNRGDCRTQLIVRVNIVEVMVLKHSESI